MLDQPREIKLNRGCNLGYKIGHKKGVCGGVSPPSEYQMTMKRGGNVIVLVSPPSESGQNAIVVRNEVLLCSVTDHVTS